MHFVLRQPCVHEVFNPSVKELLDSRRFNCVFT